MHFAYVAEDLCFRPHALNDYCDLGDNCNQKVSKVGIPEGLHGIG